MKKKNMNNSTESVDLSRRLSTEKQDVERIKEIAGTLQLHFSMLFITEGDIMADEKFRRQEQNLKNARWQINKGNYKNASDYYQEFAWYVYTDEKMAKQKEKLTDDYNAIAGESPYELAEAALYVCDIIRKLV